VCRSKHVEPPINFEIINSITKLYLVDISTDSYYDARIHEYQRYYISFATVKRSEHDQPPPSIAEVKKEKRHTSSLP
jgi:hypothetical protein